MEENIISFIVCTNNELLFNSIYQFILALNVPKGYDIEVLPIVGAKSMCSGYNQGMKASKGKYKIYIHQDLYIFNRNILQNILDIFENKDIGLIGVVGAKEIPASLVWWEAPTKIGKVYEHRDSIAELKFNEVNGKYEEVSLVDGLIIATQYDIPWREDICDGWHFYDIAQCIEFLLRGKKVVVPNQETPWCLHYGDGKSSMDDYLYYRGIVLHEYFLK